MKKEYIEGLKILEEAGMTDNKNEVITDWLGDAYYFNGNIAAAVEKWKSAQVLGSKNASLSLKIKDKIYYAPTH
jgi:hypothetical protein